MINFSVFVAEDEPDVFMNLALDIGAAQLLDRCGDATPERQETSGAA
jgi:hypothetical protein